MKKIVKPWNFIIFCRKIITRKKLEIYTKFGTNSVHVLLRKEYSFFRHDQKNTQLKLHRGFFGYTTLFEIYEN